MPSMSGLLSSPVFVGRRREVDRIWAALEAARSGRPAVFFVGGEAGVGKTRLVEEIARRAAERSVRPLFGGCMDLGGEGVPFAPIVEALREMSRDLSPAALTELVAPGRAELLRLLPDLGTVGDNGPAIGLSYAPPQGRMFELLLGLITRLATAAEPLLLVVEDIHWADRSTLDLLAFLVRNLRHGHVVLLATYRSDDLHHRHPLLPFLAEIERGRRAERFELHRFDRTEVAAQLAGILGDEPERDLVDGIFARSEGNAFFAEELLAAGGGEGREAAPATTVPDELPDKLRDVLLARVAGLSEPTQSLLRDAAVSGREFSVALLRAVTGLSERDITEPLREAVARQIVVPRPGPEERFAFRHTLLAEAIYGDLLPGERTRLHAAFARALSADPQLEAGPSRAAELAHHWYAARDLPRALDASIRAGAAAEGVLAFTEAQAQYERALELWDQVADPNIGEGIDRVALLERAARSAAQVAMPRAIAHVRAALELVSVEDDPERAGRLYELLGRWSWMAGDGEAGLDAFREAVRLVPAEPPTRGGASALAGLGQILMLSGQYRDARDLCERAIAAARACASAIVESHALCTLGACEIYLDDATKAFGSLRLALEIARSAGSDDDILRALNNLTALYNQTARYGEALQAAQECYAQAERLGLLRFFGPQSLCEAASALFFLGRWDEARGEMERALASDPEGMSEMYAMECLATLEIHRGAFDVARRRLARIQRHLDKTLDPEYIAPVVELHASLAVWQGNPEAARQVLAEGLSRLAAAQDISISWMGPLYLVALRSEADIAERAAARRDAVAATDARVRGRELLRQAGLLADSIERDAPAFAAQARSYRASCDAEGARLEGSPAAALWLSAGEAWAELAMPYPRAYALWRAAEASLIGGAGRVEAAVPLREAHRIARALGALPLLREIEALAARARIELEARVIEISGPDPLPAVHTLGLTPRELEVLRLVAVGRTNRQIGEALFVTEKTAGVHVSNILGKLGVGSRTEAAAVAHRLGLSVEDRAG
jgi:ATP/maltotriose-dependent transcriptional regulator MalT